MMPRQVRVSPLLLALAWTLACSSPTATTPPEVPAESAPAEGQAVTIERVAVFQSDRIGGKGVTTYHPDGRIELSYQHIENGRGPVVRGRARVGEDGTLIEFTAEGHETFGAGIDERFTVAGGAARWNSKAEHGESTLQKPAFYVPSATWPESSKLLFDALQRHGGQLDLLPGGHATLERAGETTVPAPDGSSAKLVAWNLAGLGFVPQVVWSDADGGFFGSVSEWYSYVPAGWEAAIPPLLESQRTITSARALELVHRLARKPPAAGLAIIGANVLDVERGRWLPDHTVVVVGDRIQAVGPAARVEPPAGAMVIEAGGKALIPGLWDMHAHLDESDGILNLASGVTTVRDLANDPDALDRLRARFDAVEAIGPHVFRSGFIEGRGPNSASSKIKAETEAEARQAVDFYAARGYTGIKIYNSMKAELVPLLTARAHEKGMRVSGHVPVFMRAEDVVRAGYDEIQHINMLFLNFLVKDDTDTRTLARFTLVAEGAPALDLDSTPVQQFLDLLVDEQIVVDPTMAVFEWMFESKPGAIAPGLNGMAARLPVQARRWLLTGGLAGEAEQGPRYQAAYRQMLAMIKKLHDRGIRIVAGTDFTPGLGLHRELELYVKAGIPAADVLRLASLGSARIMKRDKDVGSIAAGKLADLVLIDGDPLADISDLGKTRTVVRGGVVYDTSALYREVGVTPR